MKIINRDKKLKVLLVSPKTPPVGGMSTWTKFILDESGKNRETEIIVVDTAVRWRTVWNNAPIIRLIGGSIQASKNILVAFSKILRNSPHILHICSTAGPGSLRDIVIMLFARLMGIPAVIQYHTGRLVYDIIDNGLDWYLARNSMKIASVVAVFTKAELDSITRVFPKKHVIIIPNSIDLDELENIIDPKLKA